MKKKTLLLSALLNMAFCCVYGDDMQCQTNAQPYDINLKHIEGKGIGYRKGYTTLEGFFVPPKLINTRYIPFVDLRAHVFNDGKFASNAGFGFRYLRSRVWGINAYYDYRKTHRMHYNQASVGFETLGKFWDFRINGYLPVGKKISSYYKTHFSKFVGNSMIISRKKEFALKAANAEAAYHFKKYRDIDFYAAAGPYYLAGQGKTAWGGEGRLKGTWKWLELQLSGSYDKIFNGIVQGQAGLLFPFGGKQKIRRRHDYTCERESTLRDRAVQQVDRFEIIPVDKKKFYDCACNPLDHDKPFRFFFVNNTTRDANPEERPGTFELPFNVLIDAEFNSFPGDVIYVYSGDGTDKNMTMGFMLKDDQQLLSSAAEHCIRTCQGTVKLRQTSCVLPVITNHLGLFTVSIASNNVVSGFDLTNSTSGGGAIFTILPTKNAVITHNRLRASNGANGINIQNSPEFGKVLISNNIILGADDSSPTTGILLNSIAGGDVTICNNILKGIDNNTGLAAGIEINAQNRGDLSNTLSLQISKNTLTSVRNTRVASAAGIAVSNNANAVGSGTVAVNARIVGNTVTIPKTLVPTTTGINVSNFGSPVGVTCAFVRDNLVTMENLSLAGYRFNNLQDPAHMLVNIDDIDLDGGTIVISPNPVKLTNTLCK